MANDKRSELIQNVRRYLALNLYPGTTILDEAVTDLAFLASDIDPSYVRDYLRMRFLLAPQVRTFFDMLPSLRVRFAQSSMLSEAVSYGVVKGPVDWGRTMSMRMAAGGHTYPLFVTKPRTRTFDTPENQLLGYMLRRLEGLIRSVPTRYPESLVSDAMPAKSLPAYLQSALFEVQETMRTVPMASIRDRVPQSIDQRIVDRVDASRDAFYQTTAQLYRLYRDADPDGDTPRVDADSVSGLLAHSETERLLELAVLFKMIDALSAKLRPLGATISWQPLMSRSRYTALWSLPCGELSISLYKVPSFVKSSIYRALLEETGLHKSRTNPDISIAWRSPQSNEEWVHFVEVKDNSPTSSEGSMEYYRDSLYKVIGYAKDFAGHFAPPDVLPNVTLVVWDGLPHPATSQCIWVTDFHSDEEFAAIAARIVNHISRLMEKSIAAP